MLVHVINAMDLLAFPPDFEQIASMASQVFAGRGKKSAFGKSWQQGFKKRHNLSLLKTANMDIKRAQQGNEEVRDAVFMKYNNLIQRLIREKKFPASAATDPAVLAKLVVNADESDLGGSRGWRRKKVYTASSKKKVHQVASVGPSEHDPFHVSVMVAV